MGGQCANIAHRWPGIRDTFKVLNRMVADGIVGRYAVAGAVAALNYLEPALTHDVDILISVEERRDQPKPALVTLESTEPRTYFRVSP
jgi:hypothetical protein